MTDSHPPLPVGSLATSPPQLAARLRNVREWPFFALISLTPWFFGGNDPQVLAWVSVVLLVIVGVSAAIAGLERQFIFKFDPIVWVLTGLLGWVAFQLVPLPENLLGLIAPGRVEWHRTFQPEFTETIGKEAAQPRAKWIPISIYPDATRRYLTQLLGLWLVYVLARSSLASRESFRRLAWVFTVNGCFLSLFALGQAVSSRQNVIYWNETIPGAAVFGPFICRNHYPDFIALCAGMCFALMMTRRSDAKKSEEPFLKPRQIGLAFALGLMLISVLFSLSRGGLICVTAAMVATWILSRVGREVTPDQQASTGRYILLAAIAIALVIAAWLGTGAIEDRFRKSQASELFGTRFTIWKESLKLFPDRWLTGSGAGTYTWAEPLIREHGSGEILTDQVHNEYLEGLLEGGFVQLAMVMVMLGAMLIVVGQGYLQRRGRSIGPFILGAWAGLLVGVLHNSFDFAIRMPGVALATAAVAAYAMAAARELDFVPSRVRIRRVKSDEGAVLTENLGEEAPPTGPRPVHWELKGLFLWPTLLGFVLAAGVVLLEFQSHWTGVWYRLQAETVNRTTEPDRLEWRAKYLVARASLRPGNAQAQADAGQALLDDATFKTWTTAAALSGGAIGYHHQPSQFSKVYQQSHIIPAIKYLQTARQLNPLLPLPHARLALLSEWHYSTESARIGLIRFQKLAPLDPDTWYLTGREMFRRGDVSSAISDWRHCLQLSDKHLAKILQMAETRLGPEELRQRLLPADPLGIWRVLQQLHPKPADPARREMLHMITSYANQPNLNADQWFALAQAYTELDQPTEANEAWSKAAKLAPHRLDMRDRYALWLEQEERYRDAIEQLEALLQEDRNNRNWQDRLDAMRHGLDLQRRIFKK